MKWNFKDREPAHRLFQNRTCRSKLSLIELPVRIATKSRLCLIASEPHEAGTRRQVDLDVYLSR